MLKIDGISKIFASRVALEPLSLEVSEGEIFGLLGHNGAGKSTTFGILLGQVFPDRGEAFIEGHSVQRERSEALRRVGAIFEAPAFYDYLSGWDNLRILSAYSGGVSTARLHEVVELVGLGARVRDRVKVYSHGMRQRLALAQALLPEPRLIFLDEPSEGLDPEGIEELRTLILRLRDEHGLTVVISSHLLSEVEQMCDRVAILNRGRLVYSGRWREPSASSRRVLIETDDAARARAVLEASGAGVEGEIVLPPEGVETADLVEALVGAGLRIRQVREIRPTLEDFYLEKIRA